MPGPEIDQPGALSGKVLTEFIRCLERNTRNKRKWQRNGLKRTNISAKCSEKANGENNRF
jgi:hypothetical protein